MNIDFHCHVKLSKHFSFDLGYFQTMVESARSRGVDAVVITEHFHTSDFWQIKKTLDETYPYRGSCYSIREQLVFSGTEVSVSFDSEEGKQRGHVLLIGSWQAIRRASDGWSSRKPGFDELLESAQKHNLITVGAHPLRPGKNLAAAKRRQLKQLTALGFNAKDTDKRDRLYQLAADLELPVVAGSDAHHPVQAGSVLNSLRQPVDDVEPLRRAITRRDHQIFVSPWIKEKINVARTMKKTVKTMNGSLTPEAVEAMTKQIARLPDQKIAGMLWSS